MKVKRQGYETEFVGEDSRICFIPNRCQKADSVYAEINGFFNEDIVIPNTIELSENDTELYGVEEIDVREIRIHSISSPSSKGICIQFSENIDSIIIEKNSVSCKLGFDANNNDHFCSDSFCLYNKDKTELIRYYLEDNHTDIELPDTVVKIHDNAFSQLRIQKLTLPAGIKEVSFKRLGAASIQEVDCKGNITKIIGTPFDSTPRKIKVNNYMHDIAWEDYELYKSYINPRIVITKLPIIKETSKMGKRIIRLHEVIATDKAMKYRKDFSPLVIAVNPDAKFISSEQMEDGTHHVDINMGWIIVVSEEPIETYEGIHNGSKIRFIDKESNSGSKEYKVFESVEVVQHLIQNCLL